jgi:hypothetical protein
LADAAHRRTIGRVDDAHGPGATGQHRAGEPSAGQHKAEPNTSVHYGQALPGVSAIVAPATLLTGIAFYFGWQRVRSFDEYFGLNPGAVGYSTRDYVLNSLDALFLPVVVVLTVLIALALGHAYVTDAHRTGRRSPATLQRISGVALVSGAVLLLVGCLAAFGVFPFHMPYLIATLFPAAGVLLIAHAVDQRERLRGDPPLSTAARVFVALFVAVCLFWAAGLYAQTVGRDQAARLARNLDELPAVRLASNSDLDLNSPGKQTVREGVDGNAHTYSGLRLLAVADGTMWLLPQAWTATARLFAVPQADATGLSFTPATLHLTGTASANNFSSSSAPLTGAAAPMIRNVGPLKVVVDTDENPVGVLLTNRRKTTVSGVEVGGVLEKPARPLVTSKAAFCRVLGGRFLCKVDPIPRGHSVFLRIAHSGGSAPNGTLTLTVGAAHSGFPLLFSR